MSDIKYKPAMINLSVSCKRCGKILYAGAYSKGIIGKLNKKIKKAGWIHHPIEGTLCPDCQKLYAEGQFDDYYDFH